MITFYFRGSFADAESESKAFDDFVLRFRQYLCLNKIRVKFDHYVQGHNLIFCLECDLKLSVKFFDYFYRVTCDGGIIVKYSNYVN